MNLLTKNVEVILASDSQTRKKLLKQHGIKFTTCKHLINEKKYIDEKNPVKSVKLLAKKKAESIKKKFPKATIIGSDQILICNNKIFSKAKTKKEAFNNFLELRKQHYTLISSIYVLKKGKFYWKTTKKASLFMKNIKKKLIKNYIDENKKTVLSILGGYKIEDDKLKCIKILAGNKETLQGFPVKKLVEKLKK
ncbi:Maf family protein [Rickettsiales bacterium]|nr:Maf family protein [Rickettsiales bacterium]